MTTESPTRPKQVPPQTQDRQPGSRQQMDPTPQSMPIIPSGHKKLQDKVAIVTGGDSGIGRAVAIAFADQGADVAIIYLQESEDAKETQRDIEELGRTCLEIQGDITQEEFCRQAVEQVVERFGKLDILVNNAGEQHPQDSLEAITEDQLERTFETNIFAQFYMTKAALKFLKSGAAIINTTSITAYQGNPMLMDYSSTKGAIVSFTRALSNSIASKGIRVNAVAPGPIWTPLIPATFPPEKVESFGKDTPMGRPGQPNELAPAYVFLASNSDSSYISGQVIHVNGGQVVGS